jgi:tyrosyl-DNA phosphodiesterase-1
MFIQSFSCYEVTADAPQGGGTMFVGKGWNKLTSKLFHDANSKRGGVLMHVKVSSIFLPKRFASVA